VTLLLALLAVEVPFAFVAVTVKVYAVAAVNPETVIGLVAEVPVNEPGVDVAVKVVIAEPPVAPAVNATETVVPVPPSVAVPIVGACGTVVAVMLVDALEEGLAPVVFVPATVKV
jgi:hypothetical protein